MAEDTGRCVNCGFLGKLRRQIDAEAIVYEATRYDRENGTLYRHSGWPDVMRHDVLTGPTCFRNAANLQEELARLLAVAEQKGRDVENANTLAVIQAHRACQDWYPWTEYRTPKEHFDEFLMQQLEDNRRTFEQKMEADRKNSELKLDERNRQERKRTDKVMIALAIAAIILALAEIAAGLMGISSDSWILDLFR